MNNSNYQEHIDNLKRCCGDLWFEASMIIWKATLGTNFDISKHKEAYEMMHEAIQVNEELKKYGRKKLW